jgi:hypothetical protein
MSYDLIRMNMENIGISENARNIIMDSYAEACIQIQTTD